MKKGKQIEGKRMKVAPLVSVAGDDRTEIDLNRISKDRNKMRILCSVGDLAVRFLEYLNDKHKDIAKSELPIQLKDAESQRLKPWHRAVKFALPGVEAEIQDRKIIIKLPKDFDINSLN
jgi:hypothetical protein